MVPSAAGRSGSNRANGAAVRCFRMKLALESWEPSKPVVLRMLAHELATGPEVLYDVCELARREERAEG
jgi:hypothetical protein